ncbi:uncharacterized protein LOC131879751 [Tigriopus californicus]|uniref:uncharacterized protein LOC131879751 n=1 Tax=Tigriopus californicus TaxID=6832 RepID=UPI0027DA5610|nr:uncharacterized protein LOC131879751 [Tigriopus californicus]
MMDGHNRARAGLCLICLDKSSLLITSTKFEGLVRNYLVQDYSVEDYRLPNGLCGNCSQKLRAYEKLDFARILPELPAEEYSAMASFRPPRGNTKCICFICSTYRTVGIGSLKRRKKKPGRPRSKETQLDKGHGRDHPPDRGLFCLRCFAMIYPGCHHPCTPASTLENFRNIIPQRTLELLTTDSLMDKKSQNLPLTLATRGRPACYAPLDHTFKNIVKKSDKIVPLKALKRAKIVAGVSGNAAQKFVREIRRSVPVESGFKEALTMANRTFAKWFDVVEETSPLLDGAQFPIVFCKDSQGFFKFVLQERGYERLDVFLRLSIDEGRGFLKISGNLVNRNPQFETNRFKTSGVKQTFLLAIAPIKETYDHIKMMLAKLDLNFGDDLEDIYSQDLKCINLVFGLGNHASTHPCIFCLWVNGC